MLRSQYLLLSLVTLTAMLGLLLCNAQTLMQQVLEEGFAADRESVAALEALGALGALGALAALAVLAVLPMVARQPPGKAGPGRQRAPAAVARQARAAFAMAPACAPSIEV